MNTDELKPLWNAHKNRVGAQSQWSEEELLHLLKTAPVSRPWYKTYQHTFLNLCVSCLLLGVTSGC